jgi:hypothetical protein
MAEHKFYSNILNKYIEADKITLNACRGLWDTSFLEIVRSQVMGNA